MLEQRLVRHLPILQPVSHAFSLDPFEPPLNVMNLEHNRLQLVLDQAAEPQLGHKNRASQGNPNQICRGTERPTHPIVLAQALQNQLLLHAWPNTILSRLAPAQSSKRPAQHLFWSEATVCCTRAPPPRRPPSAGRSRVADGKPPRLAKCAAHTHRAPEPAKGTERKKERKQKGSERGLERRHNRRCTVGGK
jgi:hypothetical protein